MDVREEGNSNRDIIVKLKRGLQANNIPNEKKHLMQEWLQPHLVSVYYAALTCFHVGIGVCPSCGCSDFILVDVPPAAKAQRLRHSSARWLHAARFRRAVLNGWRAGRAGGFRGVWVN